MLKQAKNCNTLDYATFMLGCVFVMYLLSGCSVTVGLDFPGENAGSKIERFTKPVKHQKTEETREYNNK